MRWFDKSMMRMGRWHGVLSATKENSSSTVYGPAEAFFLGRMIICSDEHCHYDFVPPSATIMDMPTLTCLLSIESLFTFWRSPWVEGSAELRNGHFEESEAHFRSLRDTEKTILERAQIAVANGT